MYHTVSRHRLSIIRLLLASSIALTVTTTPAIADTGDAASHEGILTSSDGTSPQDPVATAAQDVSAKATMPTEEDASQGSEQGIVPANGDGTSDLTGNTQATAENPTSDTQSTTDTSMGTPSGQEIAEPDKNGSIGSETSSTSGADEQSTDEDGQKDNEGQPLTTDPLTANGTDETDPTGTEGGSGGSENGGAAATTPEGTTGGQTNPTTNVETNPTSPDEPTVIEPVLPVPAGDVKVEGSYHLELVDSTQIVEVRSASTANGAEIWLYPTNGKQHQKIYLERDSSGYYTAWIVGTGKVLDLKGGGATPGTPIVQWAHHGKDNQKWAIRANDDGSYCLINKATGLVLGKASSSNSLVGMRDDGAKSNMFLLKPVDLLSAGTYRITPRTTKATVLDVRGGSTKNGAGLILYKDTGALNQRFELVSAGSANLWFIRTASSGGWITYKDGKLVQSGSERDRPIGLTWRSAFQGGWYTLINVRSGRALDMRGGSTKSCTEIITFPINGQDSQHFTFVKSDLITPGTYTLDTAYGTRLDVCRASTAMGANIQTWAKNAASSNLNQRFRLERQGSGYILVNAKSGLVVGVTEIFAEGAANRATHNATQRYSSGKDNQIWKATIADGGFVRFINIASGMALTAVSSKVGANVRQSAMSLTNNLQKWKLAKASSASAAKTQVANTNVLFIGNSFTFYEDMPRLVGQNLSKTEVVSCTRGSALLYQHLSNDDALGRQTQLAINRGNWDYVVVQDMSTQVIDNYDTYLSNLQEIAELIKGVGATPIIYQTWAFEGGTGSQGAGWRHRGITVEAMHEQLKAGFDQASAATGVVLAKAGSAIAKDQEAMADPAIASLMKDRTPFDDSLFNPDLKHLSEFGATVVAKVFASLFKSLA